MKRRECIGALLGASLLAGCAGTPVNESARLEHQDSPQAVRIKVLLLKELNLAASAIDVDVSGDNVILEGVVENADQRERAEAIARQQGAGSEVENRITVK